MWSYFSLLIDIRSVNAIFPKKLRKFRHRYPHLEFLSTAIHPQITSDGLGQDDGQTWGEKEVFGKNDFFFGFHEVLYFLHVNFLVMYDDCVVEASSLAEVVSSEEVTTPFMTLFVQISRNPGKLNRPKPESIHKLA